MLIRFLAAPESVRGHLYRALRDDVAFPFVAIAPVGDGYDVVYEDGDPDGAGGVLLIEPFEVPDGGDDGFLGAWHARREPTGDQHGYLGTRLCRGPAEFRFVSIQRWSSPLMVARAPKSAMPFTSHPALYQPVTPSATPS